MTDDTGSFRLDALPAGNYTITVTRDGMSTVQYSSMKLSGAAGLRVQMLPAAEDKRPIARAEVAAPAPPDLGPKPEAPKRIAVGGAVQRSRLIKQVPPAYPPDCKGAGIEGTVVLGIVIGKDGTVQSARRLNRQVDDRLADAAMEAVKQWVYQPTLLNGVPVEVQTRIDVNFTLQR